MTDPRPTETFALLGSRVAVKVAGADNADGIAVLEHHAACGEAPPLHVHHDEDEIFHLLTGAVRFEVGGVVRDAAAGDTLLAPRGVPHRFRVLSPGGARYLTITRGGFEGMVRAAAGDAATPAGLEAAARLHGIAFTGPPLAAVNVFASAAA